MRKIILAATGEELEWRDDCDGDPCLVRTAEVGVPRVDFDIDRILVVTYGADEEDSPGWRLVPGSVEYTAIDADSPVEAAEHSLISHHIIRIIEEDETEPQPGPSREEYLVTEACAIILDAARNNFDYKRALRWIADLEGM